MRGRRESEVQAGILAYLAMRGDCFCWRSNTAMLSPRPGAFVRFGLPGAPDIMCVQAPYGSLVGIEVKRERGGEVSEEQKRWGENLKNHGGLYVVARDVETVQAALGEEKARVVKVRSERRYPRRP